MLKALKDYVTKLNLFYDTNIADKDEQNIIQKQRISTRVYLIVMAVTCPLLCTIMCLRQVDIFATDSQPSMELLANLYRRYPNTLSCPCRQVSIPISTFLRFEATYHEV
jgi:hypothetical protein